MTAQSVPRPAKMLRAGPDLNSVKFILFSLVGFCPSGCSACNRRAPSRKSPWALQIRGGVFDAITEQLAESQQGQRRNRRAANGRQLDVVPFTARRGRKPKRLRRVDLLRPPLAPLPFVDRTEEHASLRVAPEHADADHGDRGGARGAAD